MATKTNRLYRCKLTKIVGPCVRTEDHGAEGKIFYIKARGATYYRTDTEVEKLTAKQVDEEFAKIRIPRIWGELERLAGVKDRNEFWKGKTEAEASVELHRRIRERFEQGIL